MIKETIAPPAANYACDNSQCGWVSTATSRPLSRGLRVGCPVCQGDARFVGTAYPTAPSLPNATEWAGQVVQQWKMGALASRLAPVSDYAFGQLERVIASALVEAATAALEQARSRVVALSQFRFGEFDGPWLARDEVIAAVGDNKPEKTKILQGDLT